MRIAEARSRTFYSHAVVLGVVNCEVVEKGPAGVGLEQMRVGEDIRVVVTGIWGGVRKEKRLHFHACVFWCESRRRVGAGFTCVPPVVTRGPRHRAFEGVIKVEDGPGQHHNVVDVQVGDDDLGRHTNPCRTEGLVFALQHGEDLLIFIKYVTTAYFYRKASTSHPGTWGISSSRQSGCPRWCTGPAPSPGRREGCHRRRRKQSKGWRRHLEDTESDGAQCQDPLHCTVFSGWISSKKGQLFMWLVGEDLNDVAQQFICTKGEVSPWETYI